MILDSNVIIAYLAGEQTAVIFVQTNIEERHPLFASSISVAEILSFPKLESSHIERIRGFLDTLTILQTDRLTGEIAGAYRRQFRLSLPDAMIAATARQNNLPLITYDSDFKKIKEIIARVP